MTSPVSVRFDERQARAAFTLYDPKGNIITAAMIAALRSALEPVCQNPHLKLLTIEGAGDDFSFGASIPEHAPGRIDAVLPEMHQLVLDLLDVPAATAALVRGRCLGGGLELALACDFIFAEETATFGLPEVALGVFPPAAAALLPWKAGASRALAAIVTGAGATAGEWERAGLVHALSAPGRLDGEVAAWFDRHLASKSAAAIRHAAAAARLGLVTHVRGILPRLERLYLDDLMSTADAVEGVAAFLEKRPARWSDR